MFRLSAHAVVAESAGAAVAALWREPCTMRCMGMDRVFWFSAFVIGYTYLGYPLLLAAWARLGTRLVHKANITATRNWPSISIIVAARNEARLPEPAGQSLAAQLPRPA